MPPVPKPKKGSKKKLSAKIVLKKWRQIVLHNAGYKCEYPGCKVNFTQLHPHHYFNKGNKSIKYDPLNGICFCHQHHTNGNEAAHLDPDFKEKWLASGKRPEGWLEELTLRKNTHCTDDDAFRHLWNDRLEELLRQIDDENSPF